MFRRVGRFSASLGLTARRHFSDIRSTYVPFDDVIDIRRAQARKSILVQVNSEQSFSALHSYCSQFGSILGIHHYAVPANEHHFMLVEFNEEQEASNLLSSACFIEEFNVVPVNSPFLWFRLSPSSSIKQMLNTTYDNSSKLTVKNGCELTKESTLANGLFNARDLSDQMIYLFEKTCLNDLGTRLRYLVARQIENAFSGLYSKIKVHPFGSSVNSFGKMGCDLDLVMKFTPDNSEESSKSRLVFHTKKSMSTERVQLQRYMELISDVIQLYAPGCSHIRRILQARIPIIKYNQDYAGLECDLSMNSLSGLYMSELLYLYGNFDSRVRPLVFTIRRWAQSVGLTNPSPGKWITNFPLTLMVLFFLQNSKDGPILPSLNYLKKQAGEFDVRITDDYINCTFLRDLKRCHFHSENTASLETLLREFFEFYEKFEFTLNSISINEGKVLNKVDYSALHIINPLETALNVSKNVSFDECERLRAECRNALWILEGVGDKIQNEPWGLAALFQKMNMKHKILPQRLVTMKDLFVKDEEVKSDSKPNVAYKNESVKNEVDKIKKDSGEALKRSIRLMNNDAQSHRKVRRR